MSRRQHSEGLDRLIQIKRRVCRLKRDKWRRGGVVTPVSLSLLQAIPARGALSWVSKPSNCAATTRKVRIQSGGKKIQHLQVLKWLKSWRKPRPESGLDWLIYFKFSRPRVQGESSWCFIEKKRFLVALSVCCHAQTSDLPGPTDSLGNRCRANSANVRQSSPDSGLDFQVNVLNAFQVAVSSLGSGSSLSVSHTTVFSARANGVLALYVVQVS